MRRKTFACVLAIVAAMFALGGASATTTAGTTVAAVTDGDTLRLTDGRRVRLLQIDTPELGSGECYSRAARSALLALAPLGSRVVLERDFARRGTVNVNVELVKRGAAAPYFYGGERGRYAARLLAEAQQARASRRGLWGACPRTQLDPGRAVETGPSGPATSTPPTNETCDPNYAGGCVPSYPPDVDCADLEARGVPTPVRVVGADPHRLDADDDRLGCE
jgi:endonuclease YncB( thermonuclease family)